MYEIGRFAIISSTEEEPTHKIAIRLLPSTVNSYPWWSESTAKMLAELPESLKGKKFLDFGCGASAILAIAAAKLGADVIAVEENDSYMKEAKRQLAANGFMDVPILNEPTNMKFDYALANVGDAYLVGKVSKLSKQGAGTAQDGSVIRW